MNDDEYIRQSVQRRVGKVVLERLRRISAEQERQQAINKRWAHRLMWAFVVAALLVVLWLVLRVLH